MAIGRTNCGVGGGSLGFPKFTYTGDYSIIDDGDGNWRIKFLTSGTLIVFSTIVIDAFLLGGGASGGHRSTFPGAGGGGGYTKTVKAIVLEKGVEYPIVIGAGGAYPSSTDSTTSNVQAGGETSGFGYFISGGKAGYRDYHYGGDGGSGGGSSDKNGLNAVNGGSDGSTPSETYGGWGQGTTTREFGEADGELYASGGGNRTTYGGGAGAGSGSEVATGTNPVDATPNTGSGGGGGNGSKRAGSGGSGIMVIRNAREAA